MNIITATTRSDNDTRTLPCTPRERALFTVDWFLNGVPTLLIRDEASGLREARPDR